MTATQHTAGPWHVGGKDNQIVYGPDGYAIANAITHHGRHTEEDGPANAALIAAAPDLLAALRNILEAHDTGNCGATMGEARLCRAYADLARAAIAKATA